MNPERRSKGNHPCSNCAHYKDGQKMPLTGDHYRKIRSLFLHLLGNECVVCGSVFNLEIHHKVDSGMGENRGRDRRAWNWFDEYEDNNLSLLCHECHVKFHK